MGAAMSDPAISQNTRLGACSPTDINTTQSNLTSNATLLFFILLFLPLKTWLTLTQKVSLPHQMKFIASLHPFSPKELDTIR